VNLTNTVTFPFECTRSTFLGLAKLQLLAYSLDSEYLVYDAFNLSRRKPSETETMWNLEKQNSNLLSQILSDELNSLAELESEAKNE